MMASLLAMALALTMHPQQALRTPASDQPTLILINGRVWTANPDQPWAEAVVVAGDRIAFVGSTDSARTYIAAGVEVIDAEGRFVAPGFIDSHVHFLTAGRNLASVQLRDAATPEEFIHRIATFAKTVDAGTWITGGDWDHTTWGGQLPERSWIDSVTAGHPVWVNRLDGHMALANTRALELAGVSPDQPDIDGGEIVRDGSGRMTGILKDNAMPLISRAVPDPDMETKVRAIEAASAYVAARGVTSVHVVDGFPNWGAFLEARSGPGSETDIRTRTRVNSDARIRTRVYACAPLSRAAELADHIARHGRGDEWLSTGCVKGFMDGSLGSHTAAFFEDFDDTPGDRGFLVDEKEDLERMMREADELGLQLAIHAIGDRAIHILLNIFERVRNDHGIHDRRFRMEHSQHIDPDDIPRFADLEVIAGMQPYHAIDDGRWATGVIGEERSKTTYAFRSLLDAGAKLAFGSDWFVAPPTPLEGIYAAVTRRTLDDANPDGWVPEQKITVEEALRAYTIDAAYASFEDHTKGSLEVGKLADFAIIDRDLTTIDPIEIREAQVEVTVVGGGVVFERD